MRKRVQRVAVRAVRHDDREVCIGGYKAATVVNLQQLLVISIVDGAGPELIESLGVVAMRTSRATAQRHADTCSQHTSHSIDLDEEDEEEDADDDDDDERRRRQKQQSLRARTSRISDDVSGGGGGSG